MVEPWSQIPLTTMRFYVDKDIKNMILVGLLYGNIFSFRSGKVVGPSNDIDICCRRRVNGQITEFWLTNSERRRVLAKMREF